MLVTADPEGVLVLSMDFRKVFPATLPVVLVFLSRTRIPKKLSSVA